MSDNAFLEVSDIKTTQKLSDRINPEGLHKVLNALAKRYCPVPEGLGKEIIAAGLTIKNLVLVPALS